jgi:hypothetical protein
MARYLGSSLTLTMPTPLGVQEASTFADVIALHASCAHSQGTTASQVSVGISTH